MSPNLQALSDPNAEIKIFGTFNGNFKYKSPKKTIQNRTT